jgi:hypothetical protein
LAETRGSFWDRNRWLRWVAGGLLVGVLVLMGVVAMLARRAEPFLRARIIGGLQKRFHARVELDSFHISFGNGLRGQWGVWAEGRGLRIWPSDASEDALGEDERAQAEAVARDVPLIRLEEFSFHAPLRFARGKPLVISVVRMEGLNIDVPAKPQVGGSSAVTGVLSPSVGAGQAGTNGTSSSKDTAAKGRSGSAGLFSDVLVERVDCKRANLVLETNKPGKLPLGFAIAHLVLTGITADGPIGFEADVTNPRPLGEIHATGSFGPWQTDDPGASAVTGDYRFENADLSGFNGIAGILNSTGKYEGTLRNIIVDGETETPDFQLTHFGNPMPLHTRFHAMVDGTDGDTRLDPVDATLGQSRFTARGQVVRLRIADVQGQHASPAAEPGVSAAEAESPFRGGHDIGLNINVDKGRIEDFLHLANHAGTALLTGIVSVKAKLHIPPGPAPVHERLQLSGSFMLEKTVFTSTKIQDRIGELSLRGQGRPKDVKTTDPSTIDSTMQSDFQMLGGIITLPNLSYTVPGATIDLKGSYGVEGGALDFTGTAKLQATVSEIVGGWKGVLLKPADRFFRKGGAGTEVPIRVGGTREDPTFAVEFNKFKSSSPQRPGVK